MAELLEWCTFIYTIIDSGQVHLNFRLLTIATDVVFFSCYLPSQ